MSTNPLEPPAGSPAGKPGNAMLLVAVVGITCMLFMCATAVLALVYGATATAAMTTIVTALFTTLSNLATGAFSALYTLIRQETGAPVDASPGDAPQGKVA
jgi:hypothetical protein